MGVSKNNGTPKSSNLIGFSSLNHPFWGPTPIFGNTQIVAKTEAPHDLKNQDGRGPTKMFGSTIALWAIFLGAVHIPSLLIGTHRSSIGRVGPSLTRAYGHHPQKIHGSWTWSFYERHFFFRLWKSSLSREFGGEYLPWNLEIFFLTDQGWEPSSRRRIRTKMATWPHLLGPRYGRSNLRYLLFTTGSLKSLAFSSLLWMGRYGWNFERRDEVSSWLSIWY